MAERAHPEGPGFQEGSPYRANLFKRYAFASEFTKGKTVLDIPCGVGWGTSLLAGKHKVGIDICADAIAYANEHYPGIDFLVGDMANIPLKDNSIDVVVCLEGFEHVSKVAGVQFLGEAARVVKNNGLLVMTVPVILPGGKHSGNRYHLHEPALSDLKNILAQKFCTQSLEIVKAPDGPVVYFVGSPKGKTNIPKVSHEQISDKYPRKSASNILLTTSAAPTQSPFSTKEKRPPIGVGFLISILRQAGHEVFFIDNYLQPSNFLDADYLQTNRIDHVGIYANTICFRDTLRMLHKLERLRQQGKWQGKIIVGGPHVSVAPHTIPDFVDHIVKGEGEQAILDIVDGRVTDRIVCYPRIENLDTLPMPAWDYFIDLPYNWGVDFFNDKPVFTMNTSRGCPFSCTFCSVGSIWGRRYTCFSAERIVADIEYLIAHYGAKGIYFREDNFTLDEKRLRAFCNLLIEKGINRIPWVCESRVSNLNRDIIELMARAGAKGFYFGVESGSQRILDSMNKGITVEQIENAFKWCQEFNIRTAASVVIGVPGETQFDLEQTNKLLRKINPTVTWFNVFVGIPDSSLCRSVLNDRLYQYIDDRGLVYLQGHNDKVRRYYRGSWNAYIPDSEDRKDWTIKPKVSVLMCVHNGERFVRQALQSIYSQIYQDFEVVIVDDGSTDKTSEILVEMKDSRTFIYRNPENKGLTGSLNIGLKLCRGQYIARMDADDISHPQRFEKQVKFLEETPNCIVVGCWCGRIDADGKVWGYWEPPTEYEDIKKHLLVGNSIPHGAAMVRRSALVKIGGYDEKYIYSQDYDLWLRLCEVGELRNLGEYLYALRSWPGAITKTRKEQQDRYADLARQGALRRKSTEKLTVIPETSSPGNVEQSDSQSAALDCFLRAREEFDKGNFETAVGHTQKYKGLMDYSKLPRILNTSCKDDRVGISVIIVTYNRTDDLRRCLQSLSKQNDIDHSFEVIVVDNGQSNVEVFKQYVNQYIRCPINFNLSEGRNIGVHFARGNIVVFLDDDAIVGSDYVSSIRCAFDRYSIFGLRGRTCPKSRPDANSHASICDLGDRPFPTYCNQEGNSAWLREIYRSVGGMDPLLFGHEGSDLTYRIIKKYQMPNKVIYWPDAVIYHDYGTSEKARDKSILYRLNADYLKYKHGTDIFANRAEIEKCPIDLKNDQRLPEKVHPSNAADSCSTVSAECSCPKVSIVIPCYNCSKFLPECLGSIRNQTMQKWELFLLDDGSTDGTRRIIEDHSRIDKRIKPFFFEDNKGPYIRRNSAIDQAASDFIVIQDADDIMCPGKLETLYNEITKDERLGIVGSFFHKFFEEFEGLEYSERCELGVLTHEEIMQSFRSRWDFCWHGSAIIRKTMFDAIGLYDENPFGSDSFWLAKAGEYAYHSGSVRFRNISEFLTLRRMHADSQTGVLPTFDPRSRRVKFVAYCENKLRMIREGIHNNPGADIAAELRRCECSDFTVRYGHLFHQWENEPLDKNTLTGLVNKAVASFNNRRYVTCISLLNGLEVGDQELAKKLKNYDLLRAMAHFAVNRRQESRSFLDRELQSHRNVAAKKFLCDCFEKRSVSDVQTWCRENNRSYNLQIIDTERMPVRSFCANRTSPL